MTTVNAVNTTLSGQSGTGGFCGNVSPAITTPKLQQINDTNGNEILLLSPVASAVNYFFIQNNATTGNVEYGCLGSDSNINLQANTKGTGFFEFVTTATTPFVIFSGTSSQHQANFAFPNTSNNITYTYPDTSGTVVLTAGTSTMASSSQVIFGKANGTEAANAVTASGQSGVITTSSLTTAGGSSYAITWTNTFIASTNAIHLTLMGGTNTTHNITIQATAGSGTSTLTIYNNTAATALNGTLLIGYFIA